MAAATVIAINRLVAFNQERDAFPQPHFSEAIGEADSTFVLTERVRNLVAPLNQRGRQGGCVRFDLGYRFASL